MPNRDDPARSWPCPATGAVIDGGLCWEYCFAAGGGPLETRRALEKWIAHTGRFASLEEFHAICSTCPHCQWRPPEPQQ